MHELHLFAGSGGGILGGQLLGHTTVCAVEIEPYCRQILLQRQRDKILPAFPIWDDVCTFDGRPWRGRVNVVAGGFPCQDISSAGKGAGITGERSGLWAHMARIIGEIRPQYAFVENSPMLTSRGLDHVLGDLAALGYDAAWGIFSAADVGAPHLRKRIWILAHTNMQRRENTSQARISNPQKRRHQTQRKNTILSNSVQPRRSLCQPESKHGHTRPRNPTTGRLWQTEPALGRVAHGVANRVDQIKALGNGQVPQVAACAFAELKKIIELKRKNHAKNN